MKFIILFIANSYLTKIIPLFIRRERGMCRICYSAAPNEFDVSYKDADKGYIGAAVSGIHEISGRKINALKKKGLRRRPIRQIRITYVLAICIYEFVKDCLDILKRWSTEFKDKLKGTICHRFGTWHFRGGEMRKKKLLNVMTNFLQCTYVRFWMY